MLKLIVPSALALVALSCAASAPTPADPPAQTDTCGAKDLQRLVGRPRSEIPAAPPGARWRIACTTCPVTMDYSPARLNIFFDEATGIIREVKCG